MKNHLSFTGFLGYQLYLLPINFLMMSSLHLILCYFALFSFQSAIGVILRLVFSQFLGLVENRRIELLTSCVQGRRSPS